MSNPSGPDHDDAAETVEPTTADDQASDDPTAAATVSANGVSPHQDSTRARPRSSTAAPDPETEVFAAPTEVFAVADVQRAAGPQAIPARGEAPVRRRSWAWVIAAILVVAVLVGLAAPVTILLTRNNTPKVSQEEMVRTTIQDYDHAVQRGDLATLRGITCGQTRDNYVSYDDRSWSDTHARVAAARQYPWSPASTVVVSGDHAEANVTSYMAFDPATRSTAASICSSATTSGKSAGVPGPATGHRAWPRQGPAQPGSAR